MNHDDICRCNRCPHCGKVRPQELSPWVPTIPYYPPTYPYPYPVWPTQPYTFITWGDSTVRESFNT